MSDPLLALHAQNESQFVSELEQLLQSPSPEQYLRISGFQENPDFVACCRTVLLNSKHPQALMLAAQSLQILLTKFENRFDLKLTITIRDMLLTWLAQNGMSAPSFVSAHVMSAIARVGHLGYQAAVSQDNGELLYPHRDMVDQACKFLSHSVDHCGIGLRLLTALVSEFNTHLRSKTLIEHRRAACWFRDNQLQKVFNIATSTVEQVLSGSNSASPEQQLSLLDAATQLATTVLKFDFIGTNVDEASDDFGTLQIPSSWRQTMHAPRTANVFFETAVRMVDSRRTDPTTRRVLLTSLDVVTQLSLSRRSLYYTDNSRVEHLTRLFSGSLRLLAHEQSGLSKDDDKERGFLADQDILLKLCRLLASIKSNFQLSELIKQAQFAQWLTLVLKLTMRAFVHFEWSATCVHYLVDLWSRLTVSMPFLRGGAQVAGPIAEVIPQVAESYIVTRLNAVKSYMESGEMDLDEWFEVGDLEAQMTTVPIIARFRYARTFELLRNQLQAHMQPYANMVTQLVSGQLPPTVSHEDVAQQLCTAEAALSWLVYVVSGLVGCTHVHQPLPLLHQSPGGTDMIGGTTREMYLNIDAQLASIVFSLMRMVETRLEHRAQAGPNASPPIPVHLELSLLRFLEQFRKAHVHMQRRVNTVLAMQERQAEGDLEEDEEDEEDVNVTLVGGPMTHDQRRQHRLQQTQRRVQEVSPIFELMREHLGGTDHAGIIRASLRKILCNLRLWGDAPLVVEKSLQLFKALADGYTTNKVLVRSEQARALLDKGRHTAEHGFPFLARADNFEQRTIYYSILGRIVFHEHNCDRFFDEFMDPFEVVFEKLNAAMLQGTAGGGLFDQPNSAVSLAAIGLMHDLRGVVSATTTRQQYQLFWQWLHPEYFKLLLRMIEAGWTQPKVLTSMLSFASELVRNRSSRIHFPASSPNGVILFQETAKMLETLGTRLLQRIQAQQNGEIPGFSDDNARYDQLYQPVMLCAEILQRSLSGNFVNFGVFEYFNDTRLEQAVFTTVKLLLQIPFTDIIAFPELTTRYFELVEVLFRNHLALTAKLPDAALLQLLTSLADGIQHADPKISSVVALVVERLYDFLWQQAALVQRAQGRPRRLARAESLPEVQASIRLDKLIREQCPQLTQSLLTQLFLRILFDNVRNASTLGRAAFAVLLQAPQAFEQFQMTLMHTQDASRSEQLRQAFVTLTENVEPRAVRTSRDQFISNLDAFCKNLKEWAVRPVGF
ncbi:MAG: hypothetical protein MHM6MM_004174 [Cercozoa sp. M6MM]